jgi:hypothetical protein
VETEGLGPGVDSGGAQTPPGLRWLRMALRLERTLAAADLGAADTTRVLEVHNRAGVHRATLLPPDEDDPRWLHPGRNVLILLEDGGVRDVEWLALVAGLDQGRPTLMDPRVREEAAMRGLPLPRTGPAAGGDPGESGLGDAGHEDAWLESALLLEPEGLATLLADSLDHLRHLHLDPPGPARARAVRWAEERLLPLAVRSGGTLERRFRWWCSRVGKGLAASGHFDSC